MVNSAGACGRQAEHVAALPEKGSGTCSEHAWRWRRDGSRETCRTNVPPSARSESNNTINTHA
eukprot:3896813-Pyramimonas_sp.AAC.2